MIALYCGIYNSHKDKTCCGKIKAFLFYLICGLTNSAHYIGPLLNYEKLDKDVEQAACIK